MKQFSLYSIFQSGMVLQRQKPILIWGEAPQSSHVTVCLHANDSSPCAASDDTAADTVSVLADANGKWQCTLPAREAGEGYTLTVTCDFDSSMEIVLEQVSIGDIWLACGQSNMEFFLRYDENWEQVKQLPKNHKIHMYNVPQLAFPGQEKDTTGWGVWLTEGEQGFETFSAPGYSFARHIQPKINVPIGIIGCNWGGTTATAWLDESCLETKPLNVYLKEYENALQLYSPAEMERLSLEGWAFETSYQHGMDFMPLMYGQEHDWQLDYMKKHDGEPVIPMGPWSINRPGGLYHQMLEPLIPFPIKGALWYQGESDACHAEMYDLLMTALITHWREKWNDDFPFLFVQLAPFGRWLQCESGRYTEVRQKQELVSKTVPCTGMVSIMDIGSYYDIHPKKKMEVGRRLALLAGGLVYGTDTCYNYPEPEQISREAGCITITFQNCTKLSITEVDTKPLNQPKAEETTRYPETDTTDYAVPNPPMPKYSQIIDDAEIKSFRLTQENTEISIKNISVEGNKVSLYADYLADKPCTVSLAWADYAVINLVNEAGLPIKPFITTI